MQTLALVGKASKFSFGFKDFASNAPLNIIIHSVVGQPSTLSTCSQRSVPNQTTSSHIYFFLGQWPAPWALSKKCVKRKSALTTTMAISKAMMYSREFSCILSEAFLCGSKWTDTGAFILMCCVPYRYSPLTCSTGNILLAKFKSLHDLQISSALEHLELGQDPGAQTCPNVQHDVLAWRVGRDYSYSNCLFFPELPKIQRNCGSSERHFLVRDISNTHPPDC